MAAKKKIVVRKAICPGKYGEKIICVIEAQNSDTKELHLRDAFGNKHIFKEDDVELLPEDSNEKVKEFFIKKVFKPGTHVIVKDDEVKEFIEYVRIAGFEPYKDTTYGGTFFLDTDGIHVLNNAATEKDISFATLKRYVLTGDARSFDFEMIEELNKILKKEGCLIRLKSEYTTVDNDEEFRNIKCEIVLENDKFLNSYILNPSDSFYKIVKEFFKAKGIESITFNNTRTIFWATNGYSKKYFYYN